MDRRTRHLHAGREGAAVFCPLLAAALALFVFGLVWGDRIAIVGGGLLCLSMGSAFSPDPPTAEVSPYSDSDVSLKGR